MKKNLFFAGVFALALTLVACPGKKAEGEGEAKDSVEVAPVEAVDTIAAAVEEVAEEAPAVVEEVKQAVKTTKKAASKVEETTKTAVEEVKEAAVEVKEAAVKTSGDIRQGIQNKEAEAEKAAQEAKEAENQQVNKRLK